MQAYLQKTKSLKPLLQLNSQLNLTPSGQQ
jgi:hypothetical protein